MRLLPLSKDPFQAPTDRDMLPSERRSFVETHRTCVFGYARRSDGPAMSVVYYVPAVRCRPYATFVTPPRHLHSNDQEERLTHWISASMPWDAADTPDKA
jgi:hypothetical protein